MRTLIVKIGYVEYAIPKDWASDVIQALSEAVEVISDGYGSEKKWTIKKDSESFEFEMIDSSRIIEESKDD